MARFIGKKPSGGGAGGFGKYFVVLATDGTYLVAVLDGTGDIICGTGRL